MSTGRQDNKELDLQALISKNKELEESAKEIKEKASKLEEEKSKLEKEKAEKLEELRARTMLVHFVALSIFSSNLTQ